MQFGITGIAIGDLAEWVGSIGTILAIFFTIRYYNKDNRVDLGINVSQSITKESEGVTIVSNGWTFSALNISAVPSAFVFMGIRWKESLIKTLFINFLNYLIPSRKWIIESFKPQMVNVRDNLMNMLLTTPEEMFGTKDGRIKKVDPYENLEIQQFPQAYLIDNLARMAFENTRIVNKFLSKKKLKVIATFMRYAGKIYKLELILKPSSNKKSYYVQIFHSMHRFL
ncbi:hypothetical protein IWT30_00675 [Secundilactobacillus mixtipabuli]|uniref:Uncharacterized protein n=2 Tax=Secundilactobacillus mixtipabuli TaxID=1435342 RepID=A0A1Z5IA74_9LACO|nr:hypothetical protein IWT30_00675 [Secundilactobacillus mixtipabuli]